VSDRPLPRYLGAKNFEAVVGQPSRWCRDKAKAWGVPILKIDGKSVIPAEAFFAALEAHASTEVVESEPLDELEAMRARLGKRRVAG